tara:strand:- start:44 stop:415 length:372 start_codon:yes stop_codon:yes gene_type:complete
MAHFAKLDENNTVVQVVVVANEVITPDGENENGQLGVDFLSNLFGGIWKQTSYNNNFRKQFSGMGHIYDESADVFILNKPFPSWTLDENYDWQPPVPFPNERVNGAPKPFNWNEDTQSWDEVW